MSIPEVSTRQPSLEEEFFVRFHLTATAKMAYDYALKSGLWRVFNNDLGFTPDLLFTTTTNPPRPRLRMSTADEDGVLYVVGAELINGQAVAFNEVCTMFENGYCSVRLFIDKGELTAVQIGMGINQDGGLSGREITVSKYMDEEARIRVINGFISCGCEGDFKNKITLGRFKDLAYLVSEGRLLTSGLITMEMITKRIGDLVID